MKILISLLKNHYPSWQLMHLDTKSKRLMIYLPLIKYIIAFKNTYLNLIPGRLGENVQFWQ